MAEIKLQHQIVLKFKNDHPDLGDHLFHVQNEQKTKIGQWTAKAIGIVKGVPDLLFLGPKFKGLEIKEAGSYHDKQHIQNQVNFGRKMIDNGHEWFLVRSVDEAMNFLLDLEGPKGLTIEEVQKMIDQSKNKSIKF